MAEPDRPGWRHTLALDRWTLLAAVLASIHFGSFPLRELPIATDVRYYLYFAQQTASGALPHRDFFDNKTQLATVTGAVLYRASLDLGLDPLHAIRAGYLALAALSATLAFVVFRHLGGLAAGALALSFQCGFWLLGLLPCTGTVPKLWMATLASATALAAYRRSWRLAGILGALAALDWQIGALAWLGALVAAGSLEAGVRRSAVARVVQGAAVCALPLLAFYAWHGALGPLLRQTIAASLSRGAAAGERLATGDEWLRRFQVVAASCEGHLWLLLPALVGVPLFLAWLRRPADGPTRSQARVLAVYHYGLLAFSAWDFQRDGDLFALLHTAAFFGAVAACEVWQRAIALARTREWPLGLAIVLCFVVARPWVSRSALRLPAGGPRVTLEDQRRLAERLRPQLAGGHTAVLGASEILFLTGIENPLPFLYWNPAAHAYYRQGPAEGRGEALGRLVDAAGLQTILCRRGYAPCAVLPSWRREETLTSGDGYGVDVYVRGSAP